MTNNIVNEHALIISRELNIMRKHVSATIRLLDDGATVPFIARYRKEATGSMEADTIRLIQLRHEALTEIYKRQDFIIAQIKEQGALTPELEKRILETIDPTALEDIYLPFKPRRASRASAARDKGLEPLARMLMAQNVDDPAKAARRFVDKKLGIGSADEALAGASDIMAEWVSESEKARNLVRSRYTRSAIISSKLVKGADADDKAKTYANYFDFSEPLRTCTSHRYLAIRRGEAEGVLRVSIAIDDGEMIERLQRMFVKPDTPAENAELVRNAVADGYKRLMRPSIENEVAAATKDKADQAAIEMFADNLSQLLMLPPMPRRRVLAIDPGYRTGCKVVCLDERGDLMAHDVIYPHAPQGDLYGAADLLCHLVDRFRIDIIAVGDGTAGRETERFLHNITFPHQVRIQMVSENGASVYSASPLAAEEFPDLDVTVRGAISIGRRLIDPLAELVKIDPKSIGVGQYQHDVNQPRLRDALDYTVEKCVNSVGVNLNTASPHLLAYVSGIGKQLAQNIVNYRTEHGNFSSRRQLLDVPRLGEKAFKLCAGFLRIPDAPDPLDNTAVHPERYELVRQMAFDMGLTIDALVNDRGKLHSIDLEQYATKEAGLPTLTDIITELEKPSRDPRIREQQVVYEEGVESIADLHIGQILSGKITNITAFGAFVDIGLKINGLIHISQFADHYVQSPFEMVQIGRFVKVKVIDVDAQRGRVALTMKGVQQ